MQLVVQKISVRRGRPARTVQVPRDFGTGDEQIPAARQKRRDLRLFGAAERFVTGGFVAARPEDDGIIGERHEAAADSLVLAGVERRAKRADGLAVLHDVVKRIHAARQDALVRTATVRGDVILRGEILFQIGRPIKPVEGVYIKNFFGTGT